MTHVKGLICFPNMHTNIGLKDSLLFSRNTNLCLGGGWTPAIKATNNCLYVSGDVKTISTDCFGHTFIGPVEAIIFENFINLQSESISCLRFKHIVFTKDAFIDEKAFFSEECNSNLYKHYTLYSYKGSSVEKFAIEHGFRFKTLDKFVYKKKKPTFSYCTPYTLWVCLEYMDLFLYFTNDFAYLTKKAQQENGDYDFYLIPFKQSQFVTPIKRFIELFSSMTSKEDRKLLIEGQYLRLEEETVLKYYELLEKCFENNELVQKFKHLSKENNHT